MMDQSKIQILLKGLEVEGELYQELRDVMKRELDSLESIDKNSMMSLMKEKLSLMQRIEEEDSRISDIKVVWKDIVAESSPEYEKITAFLKNMELLLKEILETEERTSQILESFKSDVKDVQTKSKAIRATKAYKTPEEKK